MENKILTPEEFLQEVTYKKIKEGYRAYFKYQGRIHSCIGITEQDAHLNLWEYMVDEIGI